MRGLKLCMALGLILAVTATAGANTVESSTLWFEGALTAAGGGYTGTIPMLQETAKGVGDGVDGFDVYAKNGGTAYVEGYYGTGEWNASSGSPTGTDTFVIGYYEANHDAYPPEHAGGPWGTWYDPDCADWDKYEIVLTATTWALQYSPTGESPMSGTMDWANMIASETDLGSQDLAPPGTPGSASKGGGAGAWDWDCGWGVEVIPLEYGNFAVTVTSLGGDQYEVSLSPVPEPFSVATLFMAVGGLGMYYRKKRRMG